MNIKPIKSEAEYDAALTAIDGLMGGGPDTPEGDELQVLVTLVGSLRSGTLADRGTGSNLGDRACHGVPRLPAEGPRCPDRVSASCLGGAQSPPPAYPANDPALSAKWNLPADILVREYDLAAAP